MGLLDELKKQAETLRQKQQVSQEVLNQNLVIAHKKLADALRYWIELFNSLNIIKPTIPRLYFLDAANRMDDLLQCDYNVNGRRLAVDHKDYIEAVILRFRCVADRKLTIEKQTDPLVQRLRDHLWSHNLRFDLKEYRNERGYVERGAFTVLCEVPVLVTIDADLEKAHIRISCKNLEKLGEYACTYDFDEFDKPVLEELGKVILAKANSFRTFGRHQQAMLNSITRSVPRIDGARNGAAAVEEAQKNPSGNVKSILKR
jgi:hypothetical protein